MVSRLPDKSLRTHTYGQWHQRTLQLASALQRAGLQKGDRVATLCWNHHAHLEAYFGIPAAGGVMHTLNLRLSADEIGWIAAGLQGPLPDRRRRAAAAVPPGGSRSTASRRCWCSRSQARPCLPIWSTTRPSSPVAMPLALSRPRMTKTTRSPSATPAAPPAGPRAWPIRTAAPCCTPWWAAWATTGACSGTDVVLPVTPMFHANSWGVPYGAVMVGAKLVFPGPHLHPDDLLDLMQAAPAHAAAWACRPSG